MHNLKNDSNANPVADNNTSQGNTNVSIKGVYQSDVANSGNVLDFLRTKPLSELTPDQLRTVEEMARNERESKAKKTLIEAWELFVAAADDADLTITDALGVCNPTLMKGNKKPSAIKYRHPVNKELAWTGRGRKPSWFLEQLEKGVLPTEMQV